MIILVLLFALLIIIIILILNIILGYPLPSFRGAVGGHIVLYSFLLYSVYFKKDAGFGHPLLRF